MKRMKKVLAMLLAFAMVMGMSLTTFAAVNSEGPNYNNTITIKGFAEDETTTVNAYQFVSYDAVNNVWVIENWAKNYVDVDNVNNVYSVTEQNAKELAKKVTGTPYVQTVADGDTSCEFTVPVGAYIILATSSDENTTYSPIIANTYASTEKYMASVDVERYTKSDTYKVGKEANDTFVGVGQEVTFTVTTVFPSFLVADSDENSYEIIDSPEGLRITGVESVTIGEGNEVKNSITAAYEGEDYVIDLTSQIGTANANAGKTVVVVYKAVVTSEDGYSNTANAVRNGVTLGSGSEKGFTGSFEFTKVSKETGEALAGAEFNIKLGDEILKFMLKEPGVYSLAEYTLDDNGNKVYEDEATNTLVVSGQGKLKVEGLGDGVYTIIETKAPTGYSINDNIPTVTITAKEADVDLVDIEVVDTKLSALPSTGGIGTAVFTIGGCAIMVAAAYFFFVSRKKES